MKFCGECATALALNCLVCGAASPPENKFCGQCAAPLVRTSPSRFTSPESYTPKHLVEKILTSRSALEGERKQVTILFADLKGSMEFLADRDPEEARKLLDPVLEHMMEGVHRYEGTVNQVMGDGIMALFGAPLAHEDHAVRACYAALRMQETVKRYAEEVHRTQGVPLQIRIGLNSGEVVVRSIGNDLHMDYTAVGQTTHLAARVEQLAMPGSILISTETLNLAEGYLRVQSLGPMPVKGLPAPVEVYEVLGAATVRSRLQATAARGLTPFVGRDTELEQLRQAFEWARSGHGQVVAVVGEPGVGKSRLFWEFTHSHRTQGWLIVESSSVSYGKATAFLPLIDLLRTYFEIEERDDARKIRERVTGKVLSLDRVLEPSIPALLWLLDVSVEDPQWQRLDPPQRRQQTLDSIKRLLLRESHVQPLLVLFEDLHWIDEETQAFLDSLVESLQTARLLLLVNYRPEYQHAWAVKTYHQLRIDSLPPGSAEELLEGLLGPDAGLAGLKRLLIERTEGNPFFLEESVRTLIETKALIGERGQYHLARATESFKIPATAQAILASRIDRLSPEDKRLLQAASAIGKDVPFTLLRAVAEVPEEPLRRGLSHLQAAEFLYEARLFPDLEYTFKHALIHEVTYGSLLQERRHLLHAAIVDAIEHHHAGRLEEQIDRLADHAFRGGLWSKAVILLRQAGARAVARSAPREAVGYFEQALVALSHLPEGPDSVRQAVDIRFDLQSALGPLGEIARMLETLQEAETLVMSLDDQGQLGRVSAHMCYCFLWMGQADRAVESGRRALASVRGDVGLEVLTNFRLGQAYFTLGEYRRAIDVLTATVEQLRGGALHERFGLPVVPSATCRVWIALCLANLGEFIDASAVGEDGLRIATAADHQYTLSVACWGIAGTHVLRGDFGKAIGWLEPSLELCRKGNFAFSFPWISGALGLAYVQSGRVDAGFALLHQAVEQSATANFMAVHPRSLTWLSEAYLSVGRWADGSRAGERALNLARDYRQRGVQVEALRVLGDLHSAKTSPDRNGANGFYQEALGLADKLGMRPVVAHCHFGLSKLFRATDKREEAERHLMTATTMYREMDMRYWLKQAVGETAALE
jgi:class 3 adenylate cyclase/tetratricopeptide (TPR) repeat protein